LDLEFIYNYLIASERLGIWIAALLTLAIYSFLYRDNPIYRFAESLLIGISVGFLLVTAFETTIMPKALEPVGSSLKQIIVSGQFAAIGTFLWLLIPVALGLLMFARFIPRYAWTSRIALACPFMIIDGIGGAVNAIVILVGLISTLLYFYFSKSHTGAFGKVARLGTFYLMIFFGATFGYTVMARISLLIGRLTFLLRDWLGLIS
jgi:hypothetical protein